jgi:hypothetical protein
VEGVASVEDSEGNDGLTFLLTSFFNDSIHSRNATFALRKGRIDNMATKKKAKKAAKKKKK